LVKKKVFSFNLHPEVIDLIDEYRRRCTNIPSRSEAVEEIIKRGVK
jgi:predicted transcriptional regulator